jgi:hypothetical protein
MRSANVGCFPKNRKLGKILSEKKHDKKYGSRYFGRSANLTLQLSSFIWYFRVAVGVIAPIRGD